MKKKARRVYKDRDGNKLPSVTEILGGFGWKYQPLLAWANKIGREGKTLNEGSKDARDIGTCAHDLIEDFVLGRERRERGDTPLDIWEGALISLASFKRFWLREDMANRCEVIGTETLMVDLDRGYGGTADLFCLLDGEPACLDFKTGKSIYAETAIQLEAYCDLWFVDGSKHVEDSDGNPLLAWQIEQRQENRAMKRTGIIHCPADGRETTLVEIPGEVRYASQQIWPRLVEMVRWKKPYDDFGKELRKMAKANEAEPPKSSTPF
jgi:hypothetical protein